VSLVSGLSGDLGKGGRVERTALDGSLFGGAGAELVGAQQRGEHQGGQCPGQIGAGEFGQVLGEPIGKRE